MIIGYMLGFSWFHGTESGNYYITPRKFPLDQLEHESPARLFKCVWGEGMVLEPKIVGVGLPCAVWQKGRKASRRFHPRAVIKIVGLFQAIVTKPFLCLVSRVGPWNIQYFP